MAYSRSEKRSIFAKTYKMRLGLGTKPEVINNNMTGKRVPLTKKDIKFYKLELDKMGES